MSLGRDLLRQYQTPPALKQLTKAYREGRIKSEDNIIRENIEYPSEEDFLVLPEKGTDEYKALFNKGMESINNGELAVVILNGGMATRFGGAVKGIVEVFDEKSFLQLKIADTIKISSEIKYFIMNSFSTAEKTRKHFDDNNWFGVPGKIRMFNQYIAQRIEEDGTEFLPEDGSFYGPGHGDFPYALRSSGLLDEFLSSGGKYIFYSNVDNLGARVDPAILGVHMQNDIELTSEVAVKSSGDEGGAPALVNGRLQIVEGFCFPDDFDQSKIPVFNCSTYWLTAESLKKEFDLPWYLVKKKVDDRTIVQFEHLAGDMTKYFSTVFLKVLRNERFFPIKRPEDLEENREQLRKLLMN